jgi:ABC-type antimicrobial peptide transport system permease subunit
MDEWVEESMASRRFSLTLLSAFGAAGLGLALVGVYGVLSSSVNHSRRELSVRMALGALPRDVLRQILKKGVLLTVIGLAVGLVAASALSRVLSSQLYGIGPTDPVVYGLVALLTISVSLGACYFPARRAAKLDPMKVLRLE